LKDAGIHTGSILGFRHLIEAAEVCRFLRPSIIGYLSGRTL